ncbi:tetratricopeptide repeat protein [Shewanella baltica]|uniref:tetratricopeptide repeat protein n=1 Tax=Shewanella baltica TaxID=62322 RepID=UPI00217D0C49|nr:tetratricopeptide repeat protein [Shewanella baltica]MCS6121591.1 tetratricopeptide repeat protein [Shewanella baltica]
MQKLTVILFTLLLSLPFSVQSRDLEADEVELRESPQQMYDVLNKSISFPLAFQNRDQFERAAQEQGYSPIEFEQILYLLTRLNMEPNVKTKVGFQDAKSLIELLSTAAQSPYELAMVAMLNGRYLGRTEQKYQEAIGLYNEALTRINDSYDIEALILKHNIHEHLGGLHLLIRQEVPALMHFHTYRDIAYKLRNDYLIAAAEARLGFYYNFNQQLTKSLQHYSEAIRISNRSNYPAMKTNLQLQLSKVYRDLKQWDEALKNAHEAAAGFKKMGNDTYLSSCMTVIAMVYGEQGDWNKAIDYYLNAQQLDAKRGNYIAQGLNFHNLGQAYSNINDNVNALKYLLMANQIFKEKQSHHYQVYNELLIGEIAQTNQDWPLMMTHADIALALAIDLKLVNEQKAALTLIASASQKLGELTKAIDAQTRIIELGNTLAEKEKDSPVSTSALAEQQLKLELNMVQGKLAETVKESHSTHTLLLISCLIAGLLLLVIAYMLHHRRKISAINAALTQLSLQEPFTHNLGYAALLAHLGHNQHQASTTALGIIAFPAQLTTDLDYGQYFSDAVTAQLATHLTDALAAPVYVIRQGVFAVRFTQAVEPTQVLSQIRQKLDQQHIVHHFRLGFANLPLLAKSEIKMAAKLKFETVQMALACARSLEGNNDYFVALRALDFVPLSLFANPLFLHLEKGIERGLIRLDTNGNKEDVRWPCWENNQDRQLLENI